ncbi:2-keto-4-pentenoate hydratase [Chelativorans sp. ZYF759]|uniref:fumarylacetoacetate hydrolase family protein n=1 Tax=Chelativorans sp. ZYF759 TaxID=2692213 RepID=UPI00145CD0B0|nr:fumarylacetoacetate hydrolase family protein [Chelativorans sp. ZYF759]NMG41707.1 2-keto-4-pentenoate hydratase [Chelativorans sp. ZYF759]
MKLASLKEGGRDGALVVVNRDLSAAVRATGIAPTLQAALDDWTRCAPMLETLYAELEGGGREDAFSFDQRLAHSPLPRAYQWSEGSVYLAHLERCRRATNRYLPATLYEEPAMYQGASDSFVGPRDSIIVHDEAWDIDLEAGICVITDDVPMGVGRDSAAAHIKLVLLVNDVSLRALQPAEMAKGLGVLQCKPANAFSPVAVSPGTLGEAWAGAMLSRPVVSRVNGTLLGQPDGATDASFDFRDLISHLARTREIEAGSIIGVGTVANRDESRGTSCILEKRALEILSGGVPTTPFLKHGDKVRIEAFHEDGVSIFGVIEQAVVCSRRS